MKIPAAGQTKVVRRVVQTSHGKLTMTLGAAGLEFNWYRSPKRFLLPYGAAVQLAVDLAARLKAEAEGKSRRRRGRKLRRA